MSICCPTCGAPAPNPIQPPRNSIPLKPGPRPLSSLMQNPNEPLTLTSVRECDAHTALARGLAEYLGQQTVDINGRKLQLTTYTTWAEPEDTVRYPAAAVGATTGTYDRSFTPDFQTTIAGDARLFAYSEFNQDLQIDLWATDPKERSYLMAMIEEALNPVDWMYGVRLRLPFYHGTTATYELLNSQYTDSSDEALAKYRRAMITVRANMTVYRMLRFPDATPRSVVQVTSAEVDDNAASVVLTP